MANLELTVHTALDEVRMQMLGTQVLFGFGMQAAFQENFGTLPPVVRGMDAVALSLLVVCLAFLIAGPSQHRLVERGEATVRIFKVAQRFAGAALLPFALALGLDVFVVFQRSAGNAAIAAGIAAAGLALFLWYGLGRMLRPLATDKEPPLRDEPTALHEKIDQMLTEARVILPGAQALLGFQFIVTMTKAFERLSVLDRDIHFIALAAVALAVMLLLTPAAVHRLTFEGRDSERFHSIGSAFVSAALAPLALGIAADFYVTVAKMTANATLAATGAGLAALLLLALWFAVPLALRR
ncbi:MAG: hypothetical protein JOZ72_15900 [Alphaproteobacteria bacterium]|nr:hypothetical protein [Alphaproteobacteria bacterium]